MVDDPFHGEVLNFIRRHELVEEGGRLVACLSGGPDSTALALALHALRPALSLDLRAFHLNHGLRGAESDGDESFVGELCERLEIPLEARREDIRRRAKEGSLNLEDCARQTRQRLLADAFPEGCRAATGHSQNDQAETLLLKLARGAGPGGLAAMRPVKRFDSPEGLVAVRPLLGHSRTDILAYLERHEQEYRRDSSNRDLTLDRNWVRFRLLPLLGERLNPAISPTLARSARLMDEVREMLARQADSFLQDHLGREAQDQILQVEPLRRLPIALRRETLRVAVRRAYRDLAPEDDEGPQPLARRQAEFRQVEQMLELLEDPQGGECHLPEGLRVLREFELLRLTRLPPPRPFRYPLTPPARIEMPEAGKALSLQPAGADAPTERCLRLSDAERLLVRSRRPGDRFRPGSESRDRKLKELLSEARIPRSRRDGLAVLECRGKVVWVEGFPPSPEAQGQPGEEGCWEVEIERGSNVEC